jgi:RNA polymerase sigma-70 factor (ECF subfamily)
MPLPTDALPAAVELAPDEEIVQRVLDGDVPLFEILMRRYNQRLYRVARGILSNENEAEDVVQEAYVRAFEHLNQFAGRAQFSTWLTKIAVYEASARQRKRHRFEPIGNMDLDATPVNASPMDAAETATRREVVDILAQAIDALPADLRAVVALRIIEGLSTAETAECLELSPANVKTRLHRAKRSLRSWMEARLGQEFQQLYAFDGERCDRIVRQVFARIASK